ncbi:site-specific integrase [Levilactobacillus senmaizukei]|nr:site-specific integrase [Levilactobacillus senmaizukei]
MSQDYPYQTAFVRDLEARDIAQATVAEYNATLKDFCNYLEHFNATYQRDHRINQLQTPDVEQYLSMLLTARQVQNQTYNKILSHLNVYFKFLFSHNWTPYLPTLDIKSKPQQAARPINYHWPDQLTDWLANDRLHWYTRLTLLLISHGYAIQTCLKPDFTANLTTHDWPATERQFLADFQVFVGPLQDRFQCRDWFLKQRHANDPHLTLPGLHKYLRPDEAITDFSLSPSVLLQGYLINYLRHHPQQSDHDVIQALHLEPGSIDYYRRLAQRAD